jgi:hypothetical protein
MESAVEGGFPGIDAPLTKTSTASRLRSAFSNAEFQTRQNSNFSNTQNRYA